MKCSGCSSQVIPRKPEAADSSQNQQLEYSTIAALQKNSFTVATKPGLANTAPSPHTLPSTLPWPALVRKSTLKVNENQASLQEFVRVVSKKQCCRSVSLNRCAAERKKPCAHGNVLLAGEVKLHLVIAHRRLRRARKWLSVLSFRGWKTTSSRQNSGLLSLVSAAQRSSLCPSWWIPNCLKRVRRRNWHTNLTS